MTGRLRLPGSDLVGRGRPHWQDARGTRFRAHGKESSHLTIHDKIVKAGNYCTRSHSQANVAFVAILIVIRGFFKWLRSL